MLVNQLQMNVVKNDNELSNVTDDVMLKYQYHKNALILRQLITISVGLAHTQSQSNQSNDAYGLIQISIEYKMPMNYRILHD